MSVFGVITSIVLLMVLAGLVVRILLGVFVCRDARSRGMEPLLWALIAALMPGLIGVIVYLVARRDHFVLRCPHCGGEVEEHFAACPHCGQKLNAACSTCGTALRSEWKRCPHCGCEVTEPGEFTPPTINSSADSKRLMGVVIAMLVLRMLLMLLLIGLIPSGYVLYAVQEMDADYDHETAAVIQQFEDAVYVPSPELLSVSQSDLPDDAIAWIASVQNGTAEGLYTRTWYTDRSGTFEDVLGNGEYDVQYAKTVLVIHDSHHYFGNTANMMVYTERENLCAEQITVGLTAAESLPDGASQAEGREWAERFGNVFVLQYPASYHIHMTYRNGQDSTAEGSAVTDSFVLELTNPDGTVGYSLPLLDETTRYMLLLAMRNA